MAASRSHVVFYFKFLKILFFVFLPLQDISTFIMITNLDNIQL